MRHMSLLVLVLIVGGALNLWADEVLLKNGDRLTGKVQRVEGKLTVSGTLAGDVTVNMSDVQTFSTDAPVELRLKDGTTMKQRVLAAEPGYILTERSGLLAPQKFALVEVVGINVPVEPVRWHGSASLGFSLTTGNSETENFALAISLLRRSEIDRITFDAAYLYGRQSDPDTDEDFTSTDRWFAELKYDYFFTKKVYGYAAARVEQDYVAELDLRLLAGAGAGYQWIETADFNFRTEAGGSLVV
jgi:Protein of unknown function, DUF481